MLLFCYMCCFFKQKTAYEMRISDLSSDVCSSDLNYSPTSPKPPLRLLMRPRDAASMRLATFMAISICSTDYWRRFLPMKGLAAYRVSLFSWATSSIAGRSRRRRSEEHTSELQSLMRISYAVFCLKKKNTQSLTTRYRHQDKTSK